MVNERKPLVQSHQLGDLTLHLLEAGQQRLDGGAMFGVVPKPLWERRIPADERNRIPLAMRSLLFETAGELILIETGAGNKESAKFVDIYGLDNRGEPDQLHDAVRAAGRDPAEVSVVINTHMHFDHAGGNTYRDAEGKVQVAFPNARYYVQHGEWEYAHWNNERVQASYLPPNFDPLEEAGQLKLLEGDSELLPGVSVVVTPGHTPHHQSVLVRSEGETACFVGDLVPTMAHLSLPWVMGYDVEPLRTMETKRKLLERAAEEGWLLISVHDPERRAGYVSWGEKGPELEMARPRI